MGYVVFTLLLAALVSVPVPSHAQGPRKTSEDRNFYIDLYLQLVNTSGDAAVPLPEGDPDQGVLEIIFGTRYTAQDVNLKSRALPSLRSADTTMRNSRRMGFIGARHFGPMAGSMSWNLIVRVDLGAFDTSGKLTWRADAGTSWKLANTWDLILL